MLLKVVDTETGLRIVDFNRQSAECSQRDLYLWISAGGKDMKMGLVTPALWIYCLCSIPLAGFYAAGLSGWFYDYPRPLLVTLFALFLVPLGMLVFKAPHAVLANVIWLWAGATLLMIRIGHGLYMGGDIRSDPMIVTMLVGYILVGYVWAMGWTIYFNKSLAIATAFVR